MFTGFCCSSNNIYSIVYPCGFLHFFTPTMLPSYFNLQLSCFQNFSFIIFHFHISCIPHFLSSSSFFRFFFSSVLSSGLPMLFLPMSFQLSSLPIGHQIFPIRGQLLHSYFFSWCHIPSFPLFLIVSLHFPNSVPLISLMSCTPTVIFQIFFFIFSLLLLFQFPLFLLIVHECPWRLSILGIPFEM